MSTIRRVFVVVSLASVVGFPSVKAFKAHRASDSTSLDSALFAIRTPARRDCAITPYVIADRLGFLAEEGLRIKWTGETQPSLLIPSILRGDNDTSDFHPNTLALAKAGGAPVTAVAEAGIEPVDPNVDPKYRHMRWYVHPNRLPNVSSIADVGRSITDRRIKFTTSTPNIGSDLEGKLLADKSGISRERIEWINMPDGQAIGALKLGVIDVAAVHGPSYGEMEKAGALKVADSAETGLGRAAGITYWVFHDQFIEQHPEKVAAWARALRRAQAWANSNPEGARKLTEEAIRQPVSWNLFYSESKGVDSELAAPWLNDLIQSDIIPPGKVSTKHLVTQRIAALNESIYASRAQMP